MKTNGNIALCLLACMLAVPSGLKALEQRDISAKCKGLIVYHFDEPDLQKKIGVDFGTWELHPSYLTESTLVKPQDEKEAEEFGTILKVDYDVSIALEDLPYANYPVFNGVWFHLGDSDLRGYDTLVFYVRGDGSAGFTKRFKVELKNNFKEIVKYYVEGVGYSWRRIEIPLDKFRNDMSRQMKDMSSMKELTIVFEKNEVTDKKGTLYFDNIYFSGPKEPSSSTP